MNAFKSQPEHGMTCVPAVAEYSNNARGIRHYTLGHRQVSMKHA